MLKVRHLLCGVLAAGAFVSFAQAQITVPSAVNGGVFNTVAPTLQNNQVAPFQMDVNGNLKTTASATFTFTGAAVGGNASLAVTAASANVAYPANTTNFPTAILLNDGANEIFVKQGNGAVTAATTDTPIPAGNYLVLTIGANTNVAAITASSTSTLRVIQVSGQPVISGGGGGSGGTVNQGTAGSSPWLVNVANGVTQGTSPWVVSGAGAGAASGAQLTVAQGVSSSTPWLVSGGITPGTLTSSVPLSDPSLVDIESSLQAFTAGQLKIPVGTTAGAQTMGPTPVPWGGAHGRYFLSGGTLNTTNSNLIISGTHTLYSFTITAPTTVTTAGWLRIFDPATGTAPTCSSASGLVHHYAVPMGSAGSGGFTIPIGPVGEAYQSGIGFCFSGGSATNDNTAAGNTGFQIDATYE